eukprot:TRINITY_DN23633_c0_g1_i2.p1 TRINITY_DN23633_c0_g1~~TRINITY_DN23633_c0_g1_i2.p1  ORF type:complete len:162 (-),score=25.13 TRINITY_DN23633_c0_g1_i2:302-787(-)
MNQRTSPSKLGTGEVFYGSDTRGKYSPAKAFTRPDLRPEYEPPAPFSNARTSYYTEFHGREHPVPVAKDRVTVSQPENERLAKTAEERKVKENTSKIFVDANRPLEYTSERSRKLPEHAAYDVSWADRRATDRVNNIGSSLGLNYAATRRQGDWRTTFDMS